MRVGVIGINHKLADLKLREKLAKACQKRFYGLQAVQGGHYFILLSTCNRTEIYFCSQDLTETHTYLLNILRIEVEEDFDQKLYSYFGVDCFVHLARVTVGLDSAILAETEIQGQVKTCYENAIDLYSMPKELHFLFQKSLAISKKIRSKLQLGRGMPTLDHAIYNTGKDFFPSLEQISLLLVGASDINLKILSYLKSRCFENITLCNRSNNIAKSIAANEKIKMLEWEKLQNWTHFDWIIFGTKAPDYLISALDASKVYFRSKLMMDLSVPRNVDPRIGLNEQVTLMNIDDLNRQLEVRNQTLRESLSKAEEMIFFSAHQHINNYLYKENKALQDVGSAIVG